MLLQKVDRSNHDLPSSYLQPMDPVDLTYEKMISSVVGGNSSLFNLTICEENDFRCPIFVLGLRPPC
ncbi:unnamed protein product [Hymenolepis diminuta]|uniref:Uncharacterized protein n=1 Tax=Hymenolepis diminuta TaxID=6216 RepID=A0A564XVA4_HYMDI|nr:unnamed protein product [Hymenolepis diminuta]